MMLLQQFLLSVFHQMTQRHLFIHLAVKPTKVSIAKWSGFKPNLFLLDEPTKGVDIGAKQDIFQFIRNITENGSSVIYFTGEQDEALHIADRILILANGEFVGEYLPSELSPEQLLHLSEGAIPLNLVHKTKTKKLYLPTHLFINLVQLLLL